MLQRSVAYIGQKLRNRNSYLSNRLLTILGVFDGSVRSHIHASTSRKTGRLLSSSPRILLSAATSKRLLPASASGILCASVTSTLPLPAASRLHLLPASSGVQVSTSSSTLPLPAAASGVPLLLAASDVFLLSATAKAGQHATNGMDAAGLGSLKPTARESSLAQVFKKNKR